MKKTLLCLIATFLSASYAWSQCGPSCTSYSVAPITPSLYPITGNDAMLLFTPNTDDGYTTPVPIGFNFNFYCTTYSTVLIYTNGLIQFDIGVPSTFPLGYDAAQFLPNPTVPTVLNGIVAFRMDDLDPTIGGTITYTTIGTSPNQQFVVTYSDVPLFSNHALLYSGQIILHQGSNNIDIHTISAPSHMVNTATQGIEDATGTKGLSVSSPTMLNQSNWALFNTAYRYSWDNGPLPLTSITGNTILCQGVTDFYQTNLVPGVLSYNWALPGGWSGTSTLSTINATTGTSGVISVSATYTCGVSPVTTLNVVINPAPSISFPLSIPSNTCSGTSITFNGSGATSYTLEPVGLVGLPPFTDTPLSTTVYTLTGTGANGCVSFNSPTITVTIRETPTLSVNSGSICLGESFTLTPSGLPPGANYGYSSGFSVVTPLMAGDFFYTITGTSTNACVGTPVTSTVTANALPVIGVIATRTTLCKGESIVLTASGANTYVWGNQTTASTLAASPITNTVYTVIGTASTNCKSSKTIDIQVKPCTGIHEFSGNALNISMYPNPTLGVFELKIDTQNTNCLVEIYNAIGQQIISEKVSGETAQFDLRAHSAGLYYIKVKNDGKEEILKLVKQ